MIIRRLSGLNLQGDAQLEDGALSVADNVWLSAGGALRRRPALVAQAHLAGTVGLCARGDAPAVVALHSADLSALPPIVEALRISGDDAPTELYDAVGVADGRTLLLLRADPHEPPEVHVAGTTVPSESTRALLPFTPAPVGLAKSGGRVAVADLDGRLLRYSPVDDPTDGSRLLDWTVGAELEDGPGFVSLAAVGAGTGTPVRVIGWQDQVVVLWPDAYQQWVVSPDQLGHALVRSMVGAGCTARLSVAPAGDDLMLLGAGGAVANYRAQDVTLAATESGLGAAIEPATRALVDAGAFAPVAAYWPRLGVYVICWGPECYVLAKIPGVAVLGWSRWLLPVAVEALVACGGQLWVRSADVLYSLRMLTDTDEGGVPIDVRVETAPQWFSSNTQCRSYGGVVSHDTQAQVVRDGRPARSGDGGIDGALGAAVVLPGRAPQLSAAVSAHRGRSFALRLQRTAAPAGYAIDALDVDLRRISGGKGVR